MAGEWPELPLGECMAVIIDYRGKTPRKTTSGIPLITAKIIKGARDCWDRRQASPIPVRCDGKNRVMNILRLSLRETLPPKLLSGGILVKDAERLVEEAT
jgi:hypothetical protein